MSGWLPELLFLSFGQKQQIAKANCCPPYIFRQPHQEQFPIFAVPKIVYNSEHPRPDQADKPSSRFAFQPARRHPYGRVTETAIFEEEAVLYPHVLTYKQNGLLRYFRLNPWVGLHHRYPLGSRNSFPLFAPDSETQPIRCPIPVPRANAAIGQPVRQYVYFP